jgi:hypothetical protein
LTNDLADEMWPHFVPLWTDLRSTGKSLLLAGGYALFLKQQWLLSHLALLTTQDGRSLLVREERLIAKSSIPTTVAIERWSDQTPRATNDLDFVVELDLIASSDDQQRVHAALEKHGFKVVEQNARWQFKKMLDAERRVIVDFHAPSPGPNRDDVRANSRRVKPNPSLGQTGIQGRENAEAIGCELNPFSFEFNGVELALPNSVTLAIMKLIAMRDRRLASQNNAKTAEVREFEEGQSKKHAQDVCRVVAMITREENELIPQVLNVARATDVFADAAKTFEQYFGSDDTWGTQVVAKVWRAEDLRLIQSTLANWFD